MRLCIALLAAMVLGGFAASTTRAARSYTVEMIERQYRPRELTATVGDTLMFVNKDKEAHYVFSPTADYAVDLRNSFNRPVSNAYTHLAGDQVPMPLTKALTFRVECALHPEMVLIVTVKP